MIRKSGSLFGTDHVCIGHGVNTYGVMGAGIAKQFKSKFPENYRIYQTYCSNKLLKPGEAISVPEGNHIIMNIASQDLPGANATYDWLFTGARQAAKHAVKNGYRVIAIPQIGCGIGGLTWTGVEKILYAVEVLEGVQFEVWKL